MRRVDVLKRLAEHKSDLARFSVQSLSVFGSVARDEAREDGDVDILVEFAEPVGLFEFVRLQGYLEQLLGCPVDLVTPDALRTRMREQVLKEAVRAA